MVTPGLTSSRVENLNARLGQVVPLSIEALARGALVTVAGWYRVSDSFERRSEHGAGVASGVDGEAEACSFRES
jgi:hypothetical protein